MQSFAVSLAALLLTAVAAQASVITTTTGNFDTGSGTTGFTPNNSSATVGQWYITAGKVPSGSLGGGSTSASINYNETLANSSVGTGVGGTASAACYLNAKDAGGSTLAEVAFYDNTGIVAAAGDKISVGLYYKNPLGWGGTMPVTVSLVSAAGSNSLDNCNVTTSMTTWSARTTPEFTVTAAGTYHVQFVVSSTAGTSSKEGGVAFDGVVYTQTRVDPPADAANSTVTANPTNVASDGVATSLITVTLKDASSNPALGKTVTLASSRGATDTISAASGASDANGVVTFTVTSTTVGAPVFTATDITDSIVLASTATVTFTVGAVNAGTSTVAAAPTSVQADGSTTSTITVTLKDAYNNPVAGKTVTLVSSRVAEDTISAASGTSSVSGVVTFTVTSTTAGSSVFTATGDGVAITPTATVTFGASAAASTVAAAPSSVTADGSSASTITVTLKDADNQPVTNKTVTLAKTSGPGTPVITTVSGTTDTNGVATFTVTSTTVGADVFTATGDSVAVTPTATVNFIAAVVIYSDDFIGGTIGSDLNGSAPDTRLGSYGGSATATWTCAPYAGYGVSCWLFNGAGVSSPANDKHMAWLPFAPQTSSVYTVDWTWTQTAAGSWWVISGDTADDANNLVGGAQGAIAGSNHAVVTITTDATTGYTAHTVFNGTSMPAWDTAGTRASITSIGYNRQAGAAGTTMKSMSLTYVPAAPAASYATWANGTFTPALTAKLPGDNQDGDSLNNLQEYAFGTQPTVSTGEIVVTGASVTPGAPKIVSDNGSYYIEFGRRKDYLAAGLTYTVEFTAGLDVWADNDDIANPPEPMGATDGTIDAMRVLFPDSIVTPSGNPKPTFARVRVVMAH